MRLVIPIDKDRGSVATEYGLTLLLIALVIITAVTAIGIAVRGLFERRFPPHVSGPAPISSLHFRLIALGRILSMRD